MPSQFSKILEVVVVSTASAGATGDPLIQVIFGERVPVTADLARTMQVAPGTHVPLETSFQFLTLFFKSSGAAPYTVGSRWKLTVEESGRVTLERE